jgi:hypothetical protein
MGLEVTRDEHDNEQFDATRIQGLDHANKHYRWVRKDPVNVTRQKLKGYEQTVRTDEMKHVVTDTTKIKKGEDLTTAIEWGDMILMETSKDNHEARQAKKRARILRQTQGVTAAYKDAVARMSRSETGKDLGFVEHEDRTENYKGSVSQAEFDQQLQDDPEVEKAGRIGIRS